MERIAFSLQISNSVIALLTTVLLGGCLADEKDDATSSQPVSPPTNSAPQISGSPSMNVAVGTVYSFTPSAIDADGDELTFSVTNCPFWASFDTASGRLSGVPTLGDVGTTADIAISVTDGNESANLSAFSITVTTSQTNSPPQVSGTPRTSVNEGQYYSFVPVATDADGDTLTFSISGHPSWASFDETTGSLTGTPLAADVGVYANIVISVSDGQAGASLAMFSISVEAISLGSATLYWTAPTENEDGTPLTDLAGYKLYWGTIPGSYTNDATIDNPSVTTYVVGNLAPGTYEFVATAFNTAGVESRFSGTATRTIQ